MSAIDRARAAGGLGDCTYYEQTAIEGFSVAAGGHGKKKYHLHTTCIPQLVSN